MVPLLQVFIPFYGTVFHKYSNLRLSIGQEIRYFYVRNYVMENPKNLPVPVYFCTGQDQVLPKCATATANSWLNGHRLDRPGY